MSKFLLILFILLASMGLVFGLTIQVGGGVDIADFWVTGLAIPTIDTYITLPLSNNLSLTGQIGALFTQAAGYIITPSSTQSVSAIALAGFQFTDHATGIQRFIGVDGGITTNFLSQNGGIMPVIGVNGGVIFPVLSGIEGYLRGAVSLMMVKVSPSGQIGTFFPLSLPLLEVTTGLNYSF